MKGSILEDINNLIEEGIWKDIGRAAGKGFKQGSSVPFKKAKDAAIKMGKEAINVPKRVFNIVKAHPIRTAAGVGGLYLYKKYYSDANKRNQTNALIKNLVNPSSDNTTTTFTPPVPIPEKSNLVRNSLIGGALATGAGGAIAYSKYKKNKTKSHLPSERMRDDLD